MKSVTSGRGQTIRPRLFAVITDEARAIRSVRTSPWMLTLKARLLRAIHAVHRRLPQLLALTANLLGLVLAATLDIILVVSIAAARNSHNRILVTVVKILCAMVVGCRRA